MLLTGPITKEEMGDFIKVTYGDKKNDPAVGGKIFMDVGKETFLRCLCC